MYGVIPLVDALLGPDGRNPPEADTAALEADLYYRAIVVAFVPGQYAATVIGCAIAAGCRCHPSAGWGWC